MTSSLQGDNDTCVDTLSIPTIPEYNRTEIICFAIFTDRSPTEMTPAVTLTVIITGLQQFTTTVTLLIQGVTTWMVY